MHTYIIIFQKCPFSSGYKCDHGCCILKIYYDICRSFLCTWSGTSLQLSVNEMHNNTHLENYSIFFPHIPSRNWFKCFPFPKGLVKCFRGLFQSSSIHDKIELLIDNSLYGWFIFLAYSVMGSGKWKWGFFAIANLYLHWILN